MSPKMAKDWEIDNDVELRSARDPTAPIKSAVNISSNDAYELARIGKKEVLKVGSRSFPPPPFLPQVFSVLSHPIVH